MNEIKGFLYPLPKKIATDFVAFAINHQMDLNELGLRLVGFGAFVDVVNSEGGSVIIKTPESETKLSAVGERPLLTKILDRFGIEPTVENSVFTVSFPPNLDSVLDGMRNRHKIPRIRLLNVLLSHGLKAAQAQIEPDAQILIRDINLPERELPRIAE